MGRFFLRIYLIVFGRFCGHCFLWIELKPLDNLGVLMSKVLGKLEAAVENVFWGDTGSKMLEVLLNAAKPLEELREQDFGDEVSRREFRFVMEIANEYKEIRGHYSTDIKNEAREALALLLELYRRELSR